MANSGNKKAAKYDKLAVFNGQTKKKAHKKETGKRWVTINGKHMLVKGTEDGKHR